VNSNPAVPPVGYGTVTPWIIVRGAIAFIDYCADVFGAVEIARVYNEDATIGHAEMRIGDSVVMTFDARPQWPDTPSFLRLYLADGDAVYRRALAAGSTAVTEPTELFWGDRVARIRDPWGNLWWLQTPVAQAGAEEAARRAGEARHVDAMAYVQSTLTEELAARSSRASATTALAARGAGPRRVRAATCCGHGNERASRARNQWRWRSLSPRRAWAEPGPSAALPARPEPEQPVRLRRLSVRRRVRPEEPVPATGACRR
jgi:PhnB protein